MADPMTEREWAVPFLVDLRLTLSVQGRGRGDPTFKTDEAGAIWRTSLTPDGPATIRVLPAPNPATRVRAQCGPPPPGAAPRGMRVFPPPGTWRRIPSWEWHRAGVEGVRAETIIRAASVADSLERLLTLTHEEADRRLRTIPGIGVWTSAEARQRAAGDPDAVSVGDYHLKNMVGWALAGRDRSTDEEMLALL